MKKIMVIGGGISGLATAYAIKEEAQKAKKRVSLTILEADNRTGGKIRTDNISGYICEYGPSGFLGNRLETLNLISKLDLNAKLLESNPSAKKRYIFLNKRLRKIPDSPPDIIKAIFSSELLGFQSKLSILKEPFLKLPPKSTDETMLEFAERHIGREAAKKLIDPMAAGIFGGRADQLSIKACLPIMAELERFGNGSLIRAMFKRIKQANKNKKPSPKTKNLLMSFDGGMENLTKALSLHLSENIQKNNEVFAIDKQNTYFKIFTDNQKENEADYVVIATPAYAAAEIVKNLDSKISEAIGKIPYAPMVVVNFGYPRNKVGHDLNGFGFLTPSTEQRKILGSLWTSSIFDKQAPQSHVSLRIMVGGSRNPELAGKNDEEIIKIVKDELKEIMNIKAEPELINIFRHEKAIPQYVIGHLDILRTIEDRLEKIAGLFITGNAYKGVGVNDCIANSQKIAKDLAGLLD